MKYDTIKLEIIYEFIQDAYDKGVIGYSEQCKLEGLADILYK